VIRLISSLLVLLCACGPSWAPAADDAQHTDVVTQSIRGGTTDLGDPAVVAIAAYAGNGYYENFCTGTLVGNKTVVTAAHCINAYGAGNFYWVLFGSDADAPTKRVQVQSQVRDSRYDGDSYDFGVIQLKDVVIGIAPIELNTTPLTQADVGKSIRHVGFGTTDGRNNSGIKRQVTYDIRGVYSVLIESGATGMQTCGGDSGGPAFMTFPGSNVERLAGVISFGDEDCLEDGYDGRIDVVASWIKTTMNAWEAPTCADDGKCVATGCATADPDCACVADGACTAACARPENDADCPRDCAADGVCSAAACPRQDTDCVRMGGLCSSATQCQGRQCVSDPQHSGTYCSTSCGSGGACPDGMTCSGSVCTLPQLPERAPTDTCNEGDFCTSGTICNGPTNGVTRCVAPCITVTDCGSGGTCEGGRNGVRYCRPPPSVLSFEPPRIPAASTELGQAEGCSTALGLGPAWLALLLMRRRRRA
jgi:V8-like Glu-specific endopeptidase